MPSGFYRMMNSLKAAYKRGKAKQQKILNAAHGPSATERMVEQELMKRGISKRAENRSWKKLMK